MIELNIKADVREVERDLVRVERHIATKAAAQALNRTNRSVRARVAKDVAGAFGIKPLKRIRRRIFIPKKPGWTANKNSLSAGGRVLMKYVPEIWTIGRSPAAARRAQGPNRFAQTMDSGHLGLFRRKGGGRLPIAEYLVDVQVRADSIARLVVGTFGADRWVIEFDRAFKRAIQRRNG